MEKFLVIFTFVVPAIWWYLLFRETKNNYAILFWIIILLFNPFLYGRFIDGQINIYLSFALFPLFLFFLKQSFDEKNIQISKNIYWLTFNKNIFILAFISLILCLTSIHNAVFILFIWIIFSLFYFKKVWIWQILKVWFSIILLNLLWFVPFLFANNEEKFSLINQIQNFDEKHLQAFETQAWINNVYLNTLSLQWYWGEAENRFITTSSLNTKAIILFLCIFSIVLIWYYIALKDKKDKAFHYFFLLLAIVSYVLALGISHNNIFSFISRFLYDYFPLYSGFREPHKWLIFLVIFYSYYWAYWVVFLSEKVKKISLDDYAKYIIMFVVVLLPIFYTPQVLWWFSGQITITYYPKEWQEIKNILPQNIKKDCLYKQEKKSFSCYSVLVFPWHSYMKFSFTNKVVWAWIVNYFWNDILFWDNLEMRDIYTSSNRIESKIIEKYIWPNWIFRTEKITQENKKDFINDLKWLGVEHIILFKEIDYKLYELFLKELEKKKYIKIEKENKMITLFKII